jgi:hypothetical protein
MFWVTLTFKNNLEWLLSESNLYNSIWNMIKYLFKLSKYDWLIIYGFTSRSRIFHLHGDVTIAGEGLQI